MGILNRWRQLSRRYFWPHLFLGVVAAGLGTSSVSYGSPTSALVIPIASLNQLTHVNVRSIAFLHESCRRPTYQRDHWQQHTVRSVIRHLSWALTTNNFTQQSVAPIQAQQLALLDSLSMLLAQQRSVIVQVPHPQQYVFNTIIHYHPGLWIAQIQGIRAGPQSISTLFLST